jgi:hypothetical protein
MDNAKASTSSTTEMLDAVVALKASGQVKGYRQLLAFFVIPDHVARKLCHQADQQLALDDDMQTSSQQGLQKEFES